MATSSFAQSTVVIGSTSGTISYNYGPYSRSTATSSINFSNYAYLYTAAELSIPTGAQIIEVGWLKSSGTISGDNVFNVWMENNNATTIASTTWSNLISNATSVYTSSTHSFVAANNSYESVTLSLPFTYSGGSLTLIAEHEKKGIADAANNFFYKLASNKAIGYSSSVQPTGTTTIGGSSTKNNNRPTLKITYYAPVNDDAGVTELTAPFYYCPGIETIKVKIKNSGLNVINSMKVGWSLDGVVQTPVDVTTPLDIFSGSGPNELEVTLGAHTFTAAPVSLKAWTYLPNGNTDGSTSNDTLYTTLQFALNGAVTINSALATGGTNYQSFSDFTDALHTYGVCGPVVAEVSGVPFNEMIKFKDIPGTSAINTIRINGNGEVVQYANTSSDRHMLTLDGTKCLTINDLTFKTLAANYGWAAFITNGSAYDSIINCTFDLTSLTSTGSNDGNGIVFSGSPTSTTSPGDGSHLYIGNNHILGADGGTGPYYAMNIYGNCDSNVIENNLIENFNYYGIRIKDGTGNKILNNEITNRNKTGNYNPFNGIYIIGGVNPGLEIIGNRIHNTGTASTGEAKNFYGIYILGSATAADPALIANNVIYGIKYAGSGTLGIKGIYMDGSYNLIYHNTIVFDQANGGTQTVFGIETKATTTATGMDIKNNNVVITGGTGGTGYGFMFTKTTSVNDMQKNNFYVNSSQLGTQYYGKYGTTSYANQNDFQTANPTLELGSPAANPIFVDATNGDFSVQEPQLIGAGKDLLSYVPTDINGNPRSATPTIGAFEGVPDIIDAATDTILSETPIICEGTRMLSAVIRNNGNVNLTSLTINWNINGGTATQINYTQTLVPAGSSSGQTSDTVELGNFIFDVGVPITVKVWTSDPNGGTDDNTANDDYQQTYTPTNYLPSAAGILIDDINNPNFTLKIDNPLNVDSTFWDYGDGATDTFTTNFDISKIYTTAGPYTITVILRNQCGDLTLTSAPFTSLPVEMDRLQGVLNSENKANLSWNTFMEKNNAGFQIHRSENGKDFHEIGFVTTLAENGNSHEKIPYTFSDAKELTSQTYYRLGQIDLDGKKSYSNIIALQPNAATSLTMTAHPNPLDEKVQIQFQGLLGNNARLVIADISGRILKDIEVTQSKMTINMKGFASGLYFLKYTDDVQNMQMKLIKK